MKRGDQLSRNQRVIIEGTQGFGLSVLHSPYYPHATSRDTTAAAFLSETSLSPIDVDQIIMVIRSFPIRVAGNSGPLPNETTWSSITLEGGWSTDIEERASVTQTIRRVGRFDSDIVLQAIEANSPTHIVVNHADYYDASCRRTGKCTPKILEEIRCIERDIGQKVDFVGIDPFKVMHHPSTSYSREVA